MKYKESISFEMMSLANDPKVKFIGYNTRLGHKMYGTLNKCEDACIETPVAENLMMGVAMGISLEGYRPIVCFERSNFLLPAADAIINHLHAMPKMSGKFTFPVILRVVIPTNRPLDPGIQHLGDYTDIISSHTDIPVIDYELGIYCKFLKSKQAVCIKEYKEKYEINCFA